MPPIFTAANLTGLPSCLSLANGIADNASSAIMAALKERNSGCLSILSNIANGCCKAINRKLNNTVDRIRDILVVLYTDLLSALLAKRKKAVSIP